MMVHLILVIVVSHQESIMFWCLSHQESIMLLRLSLSSVRVVDHGVTHATRLLQVNLRASPRLRTSLFNIQTK